jgi:hypothetical protein
MKISKIYNNIFIYIFFVLISVFLNFFHYDEALMHQKILNYNLYGAFINDHGHEMTFARSYYSLFSKLSNIDNIFQTYFILRIFSIFSIISILFLIKVIIYKFYKEYINYIFIPFSINVLWFCFFSGGLSLRFDSLVSLCVLFSLFSFLKFKSDKNVYLVYLSFALSTLCISLHPNFLLPLLFTLPTIFKNIFNSDQSSLNKVIKIVFIVIVLILSLNLTIFSKLNLENLYLYLYKTTQYFNVSLEYSYESRFDLFGLFLNIKKDLIDFARLNHLKNFNTINYYILIILLIYFVISLFRKNKNFYKKKLLNYYVFISLSFLFLIPNKWAHHLSVLVPLLTLNFVSIFSDSALRNNKSFKNYLFIFFISLIFLRLEYHLKNNIFFYKFLNNNIIDISHLNYFKKIRIDEAKINQINKNKAGKIFYSNPEHKYLFNSLVSKGHMLEIILRNEEAEIFFLDKRFNKKCHLTKEISLKKFDEFRVDAISWLACEKI